MRNDKEPQKEDNLFKAVDLKQAKLVILKVKETPFR